MIWPLESMSDSTTPVLLNLLGYQNNVHVTILSAQVRALKGIAKNTMCERNIIIPQAWNGHHKHRYPVSSRCYR